MKKHLLLICLVAVIQLVNAQTSKVIILNLETEFGMFDPVLFKDQSDLLMETVIQQEENVVLLIPEGSKSHLAFGAEDCQLLLDSVYRFQGMAKPPVWDIQLKKLISFPGTEQCTNSQHAVEIYTINTLNTPAIGRNSMGYIRDLVLLFDLSQDGEILKPHEAHLIKGFGLPEQNERPIENILSAENHE